MVKVLLIILTILSLTCSSWRKQGLKSEQPIPWPYTLCASSNSWDVKSISLYDDPNRG